MLQLPAPHRWATLSPPRLLSALLITFLLFTSFPLSAQTDSRDDPGLEFEGLVEVSEVLLDVVVTDRKGYVIRGLGKDDFTVLEDGQPVEVTSVSFYTTRYPGEAVQPASDEPVVPAAEGVREVPSSRYFILLFHDQQFNATPENRLLRQQLDAARQAHNWVRDNMRGSDWMAVLSYDVKLNVHQDFTQDRETLLAAIGEASTAKDPKAPRRSEYRRETADATLPSLWRGLPDPADLGKATTRLYDALSLIAEATRPIVGRKNVLFYTTGFGDIESGGSFVYARPDPRYYPAMEQALNDNNVAIYPIDLNPPEATTLQSNFLGRLASDTGGDYYENVNNYQTPLRNVDRETAGYYLLSYSSEHPAGESGYRRIEVKVDRRGAEARTREGFRYGI